MTKNALFLLLALVGIAAVSAADVPIEPNIWRLNDTERRQQSLKIIDYSPEVGKVLEIDMTPSVFSYIELNLVKAITIAANADELKDTVFSLDIFADPANALQRVAVRLMDSTGEIFQYSTVFALRPGTWGTATIKTEKPASVWGGNKDKKIDFPIKFFAITTDLRKDVPDNAKLMIDNINWKR